MFWRLFNKEKIKLICFDIDNTLCDFSSAEAVAEAYIAELICKDIESSQARQKKRGMMKNHCSAFTFLRVLSEVKKNFLYHDPDPKKYSRMFWFKETLYRLDETMVLGIDMSLIAKKADEYEKRYWKKINLNLKNYPNTKSTLDILKSKGIKIATITDSDGLKGMKEYRIKLLGLDKYFDVVVTGDDVGFNKPDAKNWERLVELSGFKAKQCIMVGDHPEVDLITAKKLGFVTVWTKEHLNNDLHQKYIDYEITDIKEIIPILEKLNRD